MAPQLVPGLLKKALDLLEADPARAWTVGEIASACGVGRRTLQRQFRRFVGRMPMEFVRDLRLDRARQELLRGSSRSKVTDIATRCGFNHLGRFAAQYRARYGESPSATLGRQQIILTGSALRLPPLSAAVERPALAVLPFDVVGPDAGRALDIAEEVAGAIMRLGWVAVAAPTHARYHLRGKVRGDQAGRLRATVTLVDAATGRYLWADRWDGDYMEGFEFEERVAMRIAAGIQPALRQAEIDRALSQDPAHLSAWSLTMRALPYALLAEAAAEGRALELLEQAIELAPCDALPVALAAWCHGLRGGHNMCPFPDKEKATAHALARRAAQLNVRDPMVETMLAAGYSLAHDLGTAAFHSDRALALDGGSAWAWGRSGWIKAYVGESAEAIERFQIARTLAPGDPMNFLCSVGVAAGYFGLARYDESARWFERALSENPAAVWINHALTPAHVFAGRNEHARRSLAEFARAFPDLTIAQIRSGLPYCSSYLDRVAEGLRSAGMRYS
jgi:AraC-like DNA-binding protein/tetratricopeptide (TPR) repeat protein